MPENDRRRLHQHAVRDCALGVAGHGGAGIILSVGLMRMMAPEAAVAYILRQKGCAGGDCLLGRWARGIMHVVCVCVHCGRAGRLIPIMCAC